MQLRKLKLKLRDNNLLTTRSPALPSGINRFSSSWLSGAPQINLFCFIFEDRQFVLTVDDYIVEKKKSLKMEVTEGLWV